MNLFQYHTNPESLLGYEELGAKEYQVPGTFNGKTYFVCNHFIGETLTNWEDAIKFCKNIKLGNHDWFLPNKEELNFIYENIAGPGKLLNSNGTHVDKFAGAYYWSFSEGSASHAWIQSMSVGLQLNGGKAYTYRVRAVRVS